MKNKKIVTQLTAYICNIKYSDSIFKLIYYQISKFIYGQLLFFFFFPLIMFCSHVDIRMKFTKMYTIKVL